MSCILYKSFQGVYNLRILSKSESKLAMFIIGPEAEVFNQMVSY